MRNLLEELSLDLKGEKNNEKFLSLENLKYDTSFFVKVSANLKNWTIKNIDMASDDKIAIKQNLKLSNSKFVENFKTEDRDPEFIYKFNSDGLLLSTRKIQTSFTNVILKSLEENSSESKLADVNIEPPELTIENYVGNKYPPNDEVNLIVHRLILNGIPLLVFCNQLRTTLAKTTLKTIVNNQLQNVEKSNFYKIKNDISFVLTPNNYYIFSIEYFEKIFSFENYTKLKKKQALDSLRSSNVIEGFEKLEIEFNKGYMARSVAKINFNENEIKEFIKKNSKVIKKYCKGYQVGVNFDATKNIFKVTDEKIAPLFITYLFSERVAENILGELVYYKTFNKLNKN